MTQYDIREPLSPRASNTDAARQGTTLGTVRYVLAISLVLVVAGLATVWLLMRG